MQPNTIAIVRKATRRTQQGREKVPNTVPSALSISQKHLSPFDPPNPYLITPYPHNQSQPNLSQSLLISPKLS